MLKDGILLKRIHSKMLFYAHHHAMFIYGSNSCDVFFGPENVGQLVMVLGFFDICKKLEDWSSSYSLLISTFASQS